MVATSLTDPLLLPFLQATDDAAAGHHLGTLLEREAVPLARQVVRGHLRGCAPNDLDDVHAGVLLSLTEHLRGLRESASGTPIQSFAGYVAAVSHNACHGFLRHKAPERARLSSRVRYVLTRSPAFSFWEGPGREWLCGKASWREGRCAPDAGATLSSLAGRLAPRSLPALVEALVDRLPGPARFEDLVDAVAGIHGAGALPKAIDADLQVADAAPSPEQALEERGFLTRLWAQIRELPARQRAALLLNLRDAEGRGMIGLLPLTGTATLEALAAALEMAPAELRALWDELPKDDDWIAGRLGATRRQVINLRKCARERLARRLRR